MCSEKIDRISEIIIQNDKVLDSYLKGTFCIENKVPWVHIIIFQGTLTL